MRYPGPMPDQDPPATDLRAQRCQACEGRHAAYTRKQIDQLLPQLHGGWRVTDDPTDRHVTLTRTFTFGDYPTAVAFVNRVADLAEREGHHPDLRLTYGKVEVTWWTHTAEGVTGNDFICAAKCDALAEG